MRNETKIRQILFNEISLTVATIGFVLSAVFWVQNPQQAQQIQIVKLQSQLESNQSISVELQKIKNNDLHELQLRMDRIEQRQIELLKGMSRLEALLK